MGMKDLVKMRWLSKLVTILTRESNIPLDRGLNRLNDRIGLDHEHRRFHRMDIVSCKVRPSEECARTIFYAPNMDGQVDPGEVVWFWAPSDSSPKKLRERSIVVVGRHGPKVLGLLISPNPTHNDDDHWLDIGAGPWDEAGRQSWVRLDKVVSVPEADIRRSGAVMPARRFERIANCLRGEFGWE
ncbi:PemK-like protein [Corynebacterium pseudotuberculosis]|uniref:type II toxin-antitoxin system PemK/MazF family toxin n=1 Tax=Corynebacterium pseudotuberculosis TaxID=1719 RepID=UPI00065E0433|nr:type II toxin-antitoxin system PemK/MazF family toxin [Corynebacterium pseudotuberculosis]AKP09194.1 PemK-like protein [Corynebacterium pseudotuberculosis]